MYEIIVVLVVLLNRWCKLARETLLPKINHLPYREKKDPRSNELLERSTPSRKETGTCLKKWCSGYHYCTASLNYAWTQVLYSFKLCSWHVRDSRWWGSLKMVSAANKAKRFSSVNHTTKAIHHHHQQQ